MSTDAEIESEIPSVEEEKRIHERRLMTKIDLRILPMLVVMYLFAFLDRVNIGNAQVFGLSDDLKLKGEQYNVALCIFFIPYILFEIPSNALLKKIRPHIFLSVCMFMFGIVTVAQGFVTNYGGLLTTRFLLGFFETGIFPGCFYILAMWYKRGESQKRFTFFFLSTAIAGAFGGLLASGIGKMDYHGGKRAWRWIFILEGAATCGLAVLGYYFITDFPEDATWLTPEEKEWVKNRLAEDVGESGRTKRPVALKDLKVLITDYKFVVNAVMYFGFLIPLYGFAYFAPTIISNWKYSAIGTQLRTVPIWVASWIVSMAISIASDRLQHRFLFLACPIFIGIAGFIILLTVHDNTHVQYAALFLALIGVYSSVPICVCWFSTNLAGHNRRAIGSAFQIAFGNIGGIVATFIFLAKHKPNYTVGYAVCLASLILSLVMACVYVLGITKENKDREAGKAGIVDDGSGEDVGDLAREFRYMR